MGAPAEGSRPTGGDKRGGHDQREGRGWGCVPLHLSGYTVTSSVKPRDFERGPVTKPVTTGYSRLQVELAPGAAGLGGTLTEFGVYFATFSGLNISSNASCYEYAFLSAYLPS